MARVISAPRPSAPSTAPAPPPRHHAGAEARSRQRSSSTGSMPTGVGTPSTRVVSSVHSPQRARMRGTVPSAIKAASAASSWAWSATSPFRVTTAYRVSPMLAGNVVSPGSSP